MDGGRTSATMMDRAEENVRQDAGDGLRIWGAGTARTLRPIWAAEELGLAYEVVPIGPRTGETRTPAYTRLNPKQKIPVLVDGATTLSESVAICRYLRDAYPGDALWRPQGAIARAEEDAWCCYIYGEIDETGLYVIRRHGDLGHLYGAAPEVVAAAGRYVLRHLDVLADQLAGREHVMPQGFGLADILLMSCLGWARHCALELPPALDRYRERLKERPAYQRAVEANRPPATSGERAP